MIIQISGSAKVTDEDGKPVTDLSRIRKIDCVETEDTCGNYLDNDLADLGITGGTLKLTYDHGTCQFRVTTEYTSPVKLGPELLEQLIGNTTGQWTDGLGESCFSDLEDDLGVTIELFEPTREIDVKQIDDGRQVKPSTPLAKAAREGNLTSLQNYLDAGADIDARQQGYTPLLLAVGNGRVEAALELIKRGADVNARDREGFDALIWTALSNALSDDDAALLAKELLERGAPASGMRGGPEWAGFTPLFMANNRQKRKLTEVLAEFGATE